MVIALDRLLDVVLLLLLARLVKLPVEGLFLRLFSLSISSRSLLCTSTITVFISSCSLVNSTSLLIGFTGGEGGSLFWHSSAVPLFSIVVPFSERFITVGLKWRGVSSQSYDNLSQFLGLYLESKLRFICIVFI